jgi:predicted NBD/HSP70 family sugar kinase
MKLQTDAETVTAQARWPELEESERRVLLELLLHRPQPRIRLAESLGLSRTSLTRIARRLLGLGLIVQDDVSEPNGRGRPSETLRLRGEAAHFLGIKVVGDGLVVSLTDLEGNVVGGWSEQLRSRGVDEVVAQIAEAARHPKSVSLSPVAVGIAIAGDVETRNKRAILRDSGFLGWDEVPLADLVVEATGLPTVVANDVDVLTAAHHWFGGRPLRDPLVVIAVGAGIGSGIIVNSALVEGRHGRSGRVGHLRLGGEGRTCNNGHADCIHAYVTIPAIEHNAGVGTGEYETALARARDGEERALEAFRRAAFALGAAVAESINSIDPERLALMGEGLAMLDLAAGEFERGLKDSLERVSLSEPLLERPPFDFGLYSRGAAITAERQLLSSRVARRDNRGDVVAVKGDQANPMPPTARDGSRP